MPPYSADAERSVLGCILLDNKKYHVVFENITPSDMYENRHFIIMSCMQNIMGRGEAIDIVTLTEEVKRQNKLEKAGGVTYISSLTEACPTPSQVSNYVKIVKDKATLRAIITRGNEMSELAYTNPDNVDDFLSKEITKTFDLSKQTAHAAVKIDRLVNEAAAYLSEVNSKARKPGMVSGYKQLDQLLGGFRKGEFVVIAARPSVGKTALATQLLLNSKEPAALFSVEMSAASIAARMMAQEGQLNLHAFLSGAMQGKRDEFNKLFEAGNKIRDKNIWVDDNPKITSSTLINRAHRLSHEHNIQSVWVDYIQIVTNPIERKNGRESEVSSVSRALKSLAKEINIPVIALAQLKRGADERQDKRPVLSDLNWSGQIEQDADVVIALHRPDYYDRHKKTSAAGVIGEAIEKIVDIELIILKHRNGPCGIVKLRYNTETLSFSGIDDGY